MLFALTIKIEPTVAPPCETKIVCGSALYVTCWPAICVIFKGSPLGALSLIPLVKG